MALKEVAHFSIKRLEVLDLDGKADPAVKVDIPQALLIDIYRKMVEIRLFDEKAFALQRQGRLGTYPQILGQEATQIVPPLCLRPKDWMIPTYRGQGAYYARGMKLRYSLLYWGGDDRGVRYPESNNDMIFAIPVGSHLTQAMGLAWACKLQKTDHVALTYLGDGSSSKGDFHESLTFAGVMKLPLVFIVENNQWAISVPRAKQCAAQTFAQKALGYGVHGIQVDGNDVLAVYAVVQEAVARARRGDGATIVECETYRMGHHTTADEASRYRKTEEVEEWRRKDPIIRLRKHLESLKLWNTDKEMHLRNQAEAMIKTEVEEYEGALPPNPLNMFSDNYATAPWHLVEQRQELEDLLELKKQKKEVEDLPPVEGRFP